MIDLKPWQMKALGSLLALLLSGGIVATYNHGQREIGRREVLTAQAVHARDSLARVLKAKDGQFQRDTVRIVRSIATVDTLIQRQIDTAVVHQTDTVKITVQEATAIQDTLRSCRSVVRDCADIQRDLRGMLRADSAIIKTLRASVPGAITPWRHRVEGGLVTFAVMKGLQLLVPR